MPAMPAMPTFLHCLPTNLPKPGLALSWWAVHCETLTPVHITTKGLRVSLGIVIDPAHIVFDASHPDAEVDPPAIAAALLAELRAAHNPRYTLHLSGVIGPDKHPIPDHMIVFDIHGGHHSIWRTLDPRMIVPVTVQTICHLPEEILGTPTHWRTTLDFPVSGWQYWWEECQNALEELRPAILEATRD